jgi:hypothetical protein
VTTHMADRFRVWNGDVLAAEAAEAAERGQVVWGDSCAGHTGKSWDTTPLSAAAPPADPNERPPWE